MIVYYPCTYYHFLLVSIFFFYVPCWYTDILMWVICKLVDAKTDWPRKVSGCWRKAVLWSPLWQCICRKWNAIDTWTAAELTNPISLSSQFRKPYVMFVVHRVEHVHSRMFWIVSWQVQEGFVKRSGRVPSLNYQPHMTLKIHSKGCHVQSHTWQPARKKHFVVRNQAGCWVRWCFEGQGSYFMEYRRTP